MPIEDLALLEELEDRIDLEEEGLYRIHDRDFRIIYRVDDQTLLIQVLSVGHRRDV